MEFHLKLREQQEINQPAAWTLSMSLSIELENGMSSYFVWLIQVHLVLHVQWIHPLVCSLSLISSTTTLTLCRLQLGNIFHLWGTCFHHQFLEVKLHTTKTISAWMCPFRLLDNVFSLCLFVFGPNCLSKKKKKTLLSSRLNTGRKREVKVAAKFKRCSAPLHGKHLGLATFYWTLLIRWGWLGQGRGRCICSFVPGSVCLNGEGSCGRVRGQWWEMEKKVTAEICFTGDMLLHKKLSFPHIQKNLELMCHCFECRCDWTWRSTL